MNKRGLIVAFSTVFAAGVASAGEKELVEYRHYLMESIGGHMNNIVAIVKGEVPYKENLAFHADALADLAPKALPAFETEAMSDKTEALPDIWENWADFEQASKTFEEKSSAFSQAVASGDMAQIGPALRELGDSCKSCHDDFVEEH